MKRIIIALLLFMLFTGCSKQQPRWPVSVRKWVKTTIDVNSIYFNSQEIKCKKPFGAIKQGEKVTINFTAKANDLSKMNLVITKQHIVGNASREEYLNFKTLPMKRIKSTNKEDTWSISYSLKKIGVYGYHFELIKNSQDGVVYGNNWHQVEVPWVNIRGTGGFGKVTRIKEGAYKLPYTQTVYKKNMAFPKWTNNMVIYYIFPERFKNGNKANDPQVGKTKFYNKIDIEFHKDWNDKLPYRPGNLDKNNSDDNHYCNDFYGGDLQGIIQKLDYIKGLGANVIYLNPIFKAPSNHKYDTADYMKIDPSFGNLKTFKKLIKEAKKRGLKIILDTSLNHCGSDSKYMDRYGKFSSLGAFEKEKIRKDSKYYSWFEFKPNQTDPNKRYNQWANPTLANLKETDSYKDFAFRNKDSVTKYWMKQGAGGWRMDVTPWVTDSFWREWYKELKKSFPNSFTVAEVWFDASKYLVGDMFDSTMNYIFRSAAINFAKGGDANKTVETIKMLQENYPKPVFYRLMNLTSSHDQPRTLWNIGYTDYGKTGYKKYYRKKFLLTTALKFTLPGAPTIYYGDEIGLTGGEDPFNRGPYPWKEDGGDYGDYSLLKEFKKLATIRKNNPLLVSGELQFLYSDKDIILLERMSNTGSIIVLFNNSMSSRNCPLNKIKEGQYISLMTGKKYSLKKGDDIKLLPLSYELLKKN